jgi:DNA-binding NtrC family response regulator
MASKIVSVLLVDDDTAFAQIIQTSLQSYTKAEFRVVWKSSVEDALAFLRAKPSIDIIITDDLFPTSNGLEFCLQLNQLDEKIPVVMISSTQNIKFAVEVMKLGVEDFLIKDDLSESHFPRTLLSILNRIRAREQMRAVEKRMAIAENRSQAIRDLVVTVCHEFNNPLAAIKISSDLLQRQPLTESHKALMKEFDVSFQKIEMEVRRLRDINFEKIDFHGEPLPK